MTSSGSITFSMEGFRGSSATFTMWIRDERKPGTIRCERSGPWQADEQRFQPKWWSSSPTFGIGSFVHDLTVLGIDDRQEVRFLDARALVQAGEVEGLPPAAPAIASSGER